MPVQLIPSLLTTSKKEFSKQLEAVTGVVDMVQIDIADGNFVPNTTFNQPEIVTKSTTPKLELHMMVSNPSKEIERWGGIDQMERILFHFESTNKPKKLINQIHSHNCQAGMVLNPDTPNKVIDNYIQQLDDVMFMGVKPGFQGQELIPEVLEKIKQFKNKYPKIYCEIDGSVNMETLEKIIPTGVDAVCPGSAIFGNENTPKENAKSMKQLIQKLEN